MLKIRAESFHRQTATIGPVGVFSAGKSVLQYKKAEYRALLSLTSHLTEYQADAKSNGTVFVTDEVSNRLSLQDCNHQA